MTSCKPGGLLPDDVKSKLTLVTVMFPEGLRNALSIPFDLNDVKNEPARMDGFVPRTIDANAVLRRLDETFAWSLDIKSAEFDHTARVAKAIVTISFEYCSEQTSINICRRDGVGVAPMPYNDHGYVDPDFAMSAAVTAAIKHAAKHIGLTRELWGPQLTTRTDAGQQAVNANAQAMNEYEQSQTAAPDFQIKLIENYFTNVIKWDKDYVLKCLGVSAYNKITSTQASDILSRRSPFIQFVESKGLPPITAVTASAAR